MEEKIDLKEIRPSNYAHLTVRRAEIMRWFKGVGAYYHYKDDPKPFDIWPHIVLDDFCLVEAFNFRKVLRYPNMAKILGRQLVCKLRGVGITRIDWVVSSSYTPFAYEVAKTMGAVYEYAEKGFPDNEIIWRSKDIPADAKILIVENSIISARKVEELSQAINKANETDSLGFVSAAGAVVRYSMKTPEKPGNFEIIALKERGGQAFKHNHKHCPYCEIGSSAVDPEEEWEFLSPFIT